ncbi:BatD family protein [Salibacteraceae bacterium]|nr:BatD family protein [Salibacteraceae bacterium]
MKRLIFISLLFSLTLNAFSQGSKFQVKLDKEEILIGEQIQLSLRLEAAAADSLALPIFDDTLINEIEILSTGKVDTSFEGSNLSLKVFTQNLKLTSFDSGYFAIAPLIAEVNGSPVESNPFLISVQTVPIDTAKGIYDIRGAAQVPFSFTEWLKENWPWIAIATTLLAIIIGITYWYAKRPKPSVEEKVEPTRPAHEIAFERLTKLEGDQLWQAGKTKEFYSELTDILREYIELRFHIPALEQTTDEIIQSMRRSPNFSVELIEKTNQVLFLADLVKFAKEKPIGSENEQNMLLVRNFIDETKRTEQQPTKTNG